MTGKDAIEALKRKFKAKSVVALASCLGVSQQAIYNWKRTRSVTALQLAGIAFSASRSGALALQSIAIKPLVEFFPIEAIDSKQGAKDELFSLKADDGSKHPYRVGLRKELMDHHGVYIFFDSRGQAIYVGKARRQNLWVEMTAAFNRERGDIQKIKRVRHPERKQNYITSEEKFRQIGDHVVPLSELAAYFSAYQIDDGMINSIEAMLVRSFANDLLNKRMERFGTAKASKK